uniref:transcription factor TFIIIB component B'' homolog isoform X2 n=1 Tax=Jaculus jaculus TaxID=51337 RepID=UPI001E1B3359|nr:transcription factor TFIIIB component B'' homolog isoform X2 [Jaculus jaculus]
MFRRARLSVKPNVRPGVGARGTAAPSAQRAREPARPCKPAAEAAPKPAEPADAPPADARAAESPQKAPGSSDEKTGGENNVEKFSKSPPPASQRRKRVSSTSSLPKPSVSVPVQSHPSSPVSQDAPQPNLLPPKEKPPCSDRYRIYKAQKLREMLKEELRKEKKQWKNKYAINESQRPPDRSKMTMRDFIYYLPDNNPMTSSVEQERKTEKSLTPTQQESKISPDADVNPNDEVEVEEEDGPLLVPRVKVAEDGSIILDEESLTVEVLRTKGPCVVEENDPIFERGSTTTYSSFRKNYYSKPWSNKETDMFFLAISMVGTDFSMIGQLFPHRGRIEIKNKFKREEKTNGWRIDKAFQEKRPFDFDFFAHLLQKVLAEEEKRKQKSTKTQNLKEKNSSKPRRNIKAKKVASEAVGDHPDESVSTDISDPEQSPNDPQTVEEEESLISSGQGSEQVVLEQAQSQKTRRRKCQHEANKQDDKNLTENATVLSGSSEAEILESKCQPEANESVCNKEQNIDDTIVDLVSSEKSEERIDPDSLACDQQGTPPVATELESSASDFPVSEAGIAASCEVSSTESNCTEESPVDVKSKQLESDKTENNKPTLRSRLLRPKPNLSRAVGKKLVASQGKMDGESKNSCSETSVQKDLMENDKMNISDSFAVENTEKENPEAECILKLSEKSCQQEDSQPKICRPVRLMKTRMQRPKPNVDKAIERREILSSQETVGGNEIREKQSCDDKDIPQQMENQSCRDFCHEDIIIAQTEKQDSSFQNVQPDEPKATSECLSIPEDNKANKLKQGPLLRTRFQKPKPNIGKGTGRRGVSSKEEAAEEIIVSGEMTTPLRKMVTVDTSPQENIPSIMPATAAPATTELESDIKETGKNDSFPTKMTEMTGISVEIEIGLKETGREGFPGKKTPEVIDITLETERGLQPSRNVSPGLQASGVVSPGLPASGNASPGIQTSGNVSLGLPASGTVSPGFQAYGSVSPGFQASGNVSPGLQVSGNTPPGLKTSGNASPREKMPELIEKINTNLEETGKRELFPQENVRKDVISVSEVETDMQEIGKEMSTRERTSGMIGITEEKESDLGETEKKEIATQLKYPEEVKIVEMETELKEIGEETFPREKAPVDSSAIGEKEIDLKGTGERAISVMEGVSGKMTALEKTKGDLKEPGREISVSWERRSEEICVREEIVTDLEKTGKAGISPREHQPEEHGTSEQTVTSAMESCRGACGPTPSPDRKNIITEASVEPPSVEEKESADKHASSAFSHANTASQNSRLHDIGEQGVQSPAALEQFSDVNLSKSLPQEQKPLDVKPAPFVRSRFKRPKPNLARAVLKRETTEVEKCVPEKKPEANEMETTMIQQGSEQASSLSSENDVTSLMTSKENDKLGDKEEAVIVPGKDPSSSNSYESKEESLLFQNQEDDLVVSVGTQKTNIISEGTKESVVQTALPIRGRLKRPRPNVQRARQRKTAETGETEDIDKEERPTLQKDETKDKSLTGGSNPEQVQGYESNSQIEAEIEVVSPRVSECRVNENQSQVVSVENVPINKRNALDEEMRLENKPYVPSPAPLIRRRFQKVKPNLGRASLKKVQPGIEKDTSDQSEAQKPECDLVQQGGSDDQVLLKEKAGILTSVEISTEDCIDSNESGLAKKDAQLKAESLGNTGEGTQRDNSMSSVEEQHLNTETSHPQLLKESYYSKIAPHRRTALSPASECEIDHSGKRMYRKTKPNVTKGRGSKRVRGKTAKKEPRAAKSMLVTLRASQKEDEDDAEGFESDYEDETCHLAPEELSKAPVFVPIGLRSPAPVSAQIEETMEELEITVNVADEGCVTVVEHEFSNTDVTQDLKQENNLQTLSFEMIAGEQIQDEPGPSDGSTEAAITLLTMGEIVLQSELSTEQQCDVGLCVFPDTRSEDQSHIPLRTDNVNHKIAHEYQELSLPAISVSPTSFDENKIILKEENTRQETGIMEETKENNTPIRYAASTANTNLRMESEIVKPNPNSEKILGHIGFSAHQEVPNVCIAKGTEVEIQRETEKNDSKAVEMEDKNLGLTAESKELNHWTCVHDIKGTSISQEANLMERNEDQEEKLQEVQILSVTPLDSPETRFHMLGSGNVGDSSVEEALKKNSNDDSELMLHVPEGIPATIPEVQQENVINPQDQTVNLFADLHQDEEDEQAFILTLVEIPASAAGGFTDATVQSVPSPLLPAPILVKSRNKGERDDLSVSLPSTSLVQDVMYLSNSNSGGEDSENSHANLDFTSRKRFPCRLDESDLVPPAKKSSLMSRVGYQEFASEVSSTEVNVFEEPGDPQKDQVIFPVSGSTTPKSQKEKIESTLPNIEAEPLDEEKDPCSEKNMTREETTASGKEERAHPASHSEQMDGRASSSEPPPLSRPGRRPLGFLSLICPKNSLDSDEATHVRSKKRLKPLIPVSRRNLKKLNLHNESPKKSQESSDSLPSTSVATDIQSKNTGSSTQISSEQPLLNGNHKNERKRTSQEEPTTISESFFGDIFIKVDENE